MINLNVKVQHLFIRQNTEGYQFKILLKTVPLKIKLKKILKYFLI